MPDNGLYRAGSSRIRRIATIPLDERIPRCERCGLDFSFADAADGPAFFVMFVAGFIVAGSALAVEALYAPPYWVHALLWGPLILITTLLPLRPVKGLLIALQYHHKAAESRFTGGGAP